MLGMDESRWKPKALRLSSFSVAKAVAVMTCWLNTSVSRTATVEAVPPIMATRKTAKALTSLGRIQPRAFFHMLRFPFCLDGSTRAIRTAYVRAKPRTDIPHLYLIIGRPG